MAERKRECVVQRATGYTVMSNYHLRDANLRLEDVGLLSKILSLPEDWDYTIAGLAKICSCGKDKIRKSLQSLEKAGYISRSRVRAEDGTLGGTQYIIRETPEQSAQPMSGFPTQVEPTQAEPTLENPTELNTKEELITKGINPPISPEKAEDQPKGKRTRKNRDKAKDKEQPKDLLDDGQLKAVLVAQVDVLSKVFPMDAAQKNRLYKIALHWYTPRTLAGKNAAPPVHTELGINNLFRKLERGARVIGINAAMEVFYDALSRGYTDIHDERFKVGYQPGKGNGGRGQTPAPAEGMGERMC